MKKTILQWTGWAVLMAGLLLAGACKDDKDPKPNPTPPPTPVSQETQERNAFAELIMTDVYLWSAEAKQTINSQKLDYQTETDPVAYFNKLVYKDDRWSEMTNQIADVEDEFSGTQTTFGYSLLGVSFVDANKKPTGEYCAVVAYVYKGSPAEKAGLKRGDILLRIGGKMITADTYLNLYYSSSISIDLGMVTAQGIALKGQTVSMTAVKMYEDPIVYQNVIEKGGKKIGYLFYTNYVLGKDSDPYSGLHDLIRTFQEFQDQGVEEVVLDLRYNGGGYALTSELLCDILAPQSAMGQVMTKQISNTKYAKYWTGQTLYSDVLEIREDDDGSVTKIPVPVDLNLSRLYVLTSGNTASASESTIIGLKPYLNLVQIGTTTHGKYCGGILVSWQNYNETKNMASLKNWGAYTMVYKFTNKDNITFVNGLAPSYTVNEDIWDMAPIGDESDPLLAKALEAITGTRSAFTRGLTFEGPAYLPIPDAPLKTNALDGKMIDSQAWDKIKEVR